jgi:hypothetical protein
MHEHHNLSPSSAGSVVLELGPGIGALLLHTPAELDGAEIEISPVPADGEPPAKRTHSQVRPRHTANGVKHAAVYPGLAEGQYTLWRDAHRPALGFVIEGGQVTIARWPEPAEADVTEQPGH